MKIRPLQDRILVKRIEEEETTAGAIIISDTAKKRSQKGKVVAVVKGKEPRGRCPRHRGIGG